VSADSQASGTNYLALTGLTNSGQIAAGGWVKVNSINKRVSGYDTPVALTWGTTTPNRALIALQQDWSGSGTAQQYQLGWYKEGGSDGSSSVLFTTLGVWRFYFFYVNGTSLVVHYGTETGSLSSYSTTMSGLTATDIDAVRLGSDNFGTVAVGELAHASFRGWKVWTNTTFTSGEVTSERDSATFAPVKSSGLISYIPIVNGTSPETATTGSNWTRTGTFTDDASNPSFASGFTLSMGQGSMSVSGQAAALKASRKLPLANGSVSLTGQSATLTKGNAGHVLAMAQGSTVLTGQALVLRHGYTLPMSCATSDVTGDTTGITLRKASKLTAAQGSYALRADPETHVAC
jgi:hypothetical protein